MKDVLRKRAGIYSLFFFVFMLVTCLLISVMSVLAIAKVTLSSSEFVTFLNNVYTFLTGGLFFSNTKTLFIEILYVFLGLLGVALTIVGIVYSVKNINSIGLFNTRKYPIANCIFIILFLTAEVLFLIFNLIGVLPEGINAFFGTHTVGAIVYFVMFGVRLVFGVLALITGFTCLIGGVNRTFLTGSSFYTGMYEQPEIKQEQTQSKPSPNKQTEKKEESAIPKNAKSRALIENIMKLEELKKSGKISDVQYTKMKQKLIKNY